MGFLSFYQGDDKKSIEKEIKKIIKAKEEMSKIDKLLDNDLPFGTGPIVNALDEFLQRNKIQRQQYHGKAFNGNHVHKALQVPVIHDLFKVPKEVVKSKIEDKIGIGKMRLVATKLKKLEEIKDLFLLYGEVHNSMNHCNFMNDAEIYHLATYIKKFMVSYRTTGMSVTPKLHMLEQHVIEQVKKWHFGLGLLGEQGGEAIHAVFNKRRRFVSGMPDKAKQNLSIMRAHFTTTIPVIQNEVVQPKRRKRAIAEE
ncbi:uncharacterized protein LOC117100889 [Anneissia japonica]|uniref:uncharacterized protein LOC117100889 n=1 Tax=Anneissia japonica TaxID=1529436 RepID=UPI001425B914|nr:uncharacterized protein LOC117100889 [Anneissia japonica]